MLEEGLKARYFKQHRADAHRALCSARFQTQRDDIAFTQTVNTDFSYRTAPRFYRSEMTSYQTRPLTVTITPKVLRLIIDLFFCIVYIIDIDFARA